MKLSIIDKIRILFETQFNHWALFPLVVSLSVWNQLLMSSSITVDFIGWGIIGIYPIANRIISVYVKKAWLFFMANLAVIFGLGLYALFCSESSITYILCLIFYFVMTIYQKFTKNRYLTNGIFPLIIPMFISVLAVLILNNLGFSEFNTFYIIMNMVIIVAYVLGIFLQHYVTTIVVNEGSAGNVPIEEIFRSSFIMVIGFAVLIIVAMTVVINIEPLKEFFQMVHDKIMELIRTIIGMLATQSEEQSLMMEEMDKTLDIEEEIGSSNFAAILNIIVWSIMAVVSVLVIAFVFSNVARFVYNFFTTKLDDNDNKEVEEATDDIHENLNDGSSRRQRPALFDLFKNDTERIRGLYKKKLLTDSIFMRRKDTPDLDRDKITAREYGDYTDNQTIADIYEKARYSGQECTKEDLKRMKSACK